MLKPVSCDHVTSFNHDDKKARDVGLTFWWHLSNNMPDSIFHESMRRGITCVCFFCFCFVFLLLFFLCGVILLVFFRMKEMESVLSLKQGCCVFIQYNLLKGSCEWILIQPWTQVIDYSLLGLTRHTRLRISISHLSMSEIVVHGRCYISHYFYFLLFFTFWLFVGWYLFVVFVFMFVRQLSQQSRIHTNLFTFFLIDL